MSTTHQSKESETEAVIYCKSGDTEGFGECDHFEHHEQLEGRFENGVKCRVRKVQPSSHSKDPKYYFTYKIKDTSQSIDSNFEYTTEVDQAFFEGFRKVADRLLVKTRYVFKSTSVTMSLVQGSEEKKTTIPNVLYEVDVYTKEDGHVSEWVKIDVEVDDIVEHLSEQHPDLKDFKLKIKVSHLPFKPMEVTLPDKQDPENQALLDAIWSGFVQRVT